ncbi:MAG: molybdopterin-dependent oxidoreductase [Proteobacteria bacterium]|nr:molybdopterin-dependent oxidoreductase [Pseudomonadota bacterium]
MNRREFLKISGFVGTSLIGGVNINEADPYNLWKPIPLNRLEKTKTICSLCKNFCSLNVYKRKEIIISLEPDNKNAICPKVIAYHNILYDSNRIKTPLLRSSKRGDLKFKAISYESAIEILKDKVSEGLFFDAYAAGEAEKYYLNGLSEKINFYPDNRFKEILGADYIYFDTDKADLILNFGSDLILDNMLYKNAESLSSLAKRIINFTPLVTNDTALGSQWVPVKIEDLAVTISKIISGLKGGELDKDLQSVVNRIKNSKNVCLTFSEKLTETNSGINSLSEIISLAKALNIINKEGGIFLYKHQYGSKSFNLFSEKIKNYAIYNMDPFLIYLTDNFKKALNEIPFIVYFGNEMTEIAKYADLIIPIPYFFERSDMYINRSESGFRFSIAPHAISGGVEAIEMRDKANIELLFQKIFNYKAPYGIKDISEIARNINNKLLEKENLIANLKEKNPYSQVAPSLVDKVPMTGNKFSVYLYNDSIISFKTRGSKWAEEMGNSNPLLINPKTASKYGLKHGQKAILRTNGNNVIVKVFLYEGIAEGVIGLKRYKIKMSGNAYVKGERKFFEKDKEVREIWWKNADVELEKLFTNESYKALIVLKQNSFEISKG